MTSKASLFKSFFNKTLFLSALKRYWWISAAYSAILTIMLPLKYALTDPSAYGFYNKFAAPDGTRYLNLLRESFGFQVFLLVTIPVGVAALVFSYIQNTKHSTFIHSLPCCRSQVFASYAACGMVLLLAPIFINAVALVFIKAATRWNERISILDLDIGNWALVTLVYLSVFFAVCVFTGMFTGSSAAQIVFSYILHLLVPGVAQMSIVLARVLLKGFPEYYNYSWNFFPIVSWENILGIEQNKASQISAILLIYALLAAFFLVGAYVAYKFRPAESAGNLISFPFMNRIFKYGVTACSSLFFATLTAGALSFSKATASVFLGAAIGSFIGYWAAEMLIQKSLKVWSSYRGYLTSLAIIMLVLAGVRADVLGYVKRIPEPSQVECVYFGENAKYLMDSEENTGQKTAQNVYDMGRNYNTARFDNPEDIKNIVSFHKAAISKSSDNNTYYAPRKELAYALKNGKKLIRSYRLDEESMMEYLLPLYNSEQYKKSCFPLMNSNAGEIKKLELSNSVFPMKTVLIDDKAELADFLEAYKKDVLIRKFNFDPFKYSFMYSIFVTYKFDGALQSNREYAPIINSREYLTGFDNLFSNVIEWLKVKGYFDKIEFKPEMIKSAVYVPHQVAGGIEFAKFNPYSPGGSIEETLKLPGAVGIEDKDILRHVAGEISDLQRYYNTSKMTEGILYMEIDTGENKMIRDFGIYENSDISLMIKDYIAKKTAK